MYSNIIFSILLTGTSPHKKHTSLADLRLMVYNGFMRNQVSFLKILKRLFFHVSSSILLLRVFSIHPQSLCPTFLLPFSWIAQFLLYWVHTSACHQCLWIFKNWLNLTYMYFYFPMNTFHNKTTLETLRLFLLIVQISLSQIIPDWYLS